MKKLSREQLEDLAAKKLQGSITPAENELLNAWLLQQPEEVLIELKLNRHKDHIENELLTRIKATTGISSSPGKSRTIPIKRISQWAAAAVLLLVTGYFFWINQKQPAPSLTILPEPELINREAPNSIRAYITLSNGEKIDVDSIYVKKDKYPELALLQEQQDGRISYSALKNQATFGNLKNTFNNPKGSQIARIVLSDGTGVWLNSGSSITYPLFFEETERRVSIEGEAYFEVAHNGQWPFFVNKNNVTIEVLGTHFNVNAYTDEEELRVTLLEGSVKVSKTEDGSKPTNLLLKPGMESRIAIRKQGSSGYTGAIKALENVDLKQVMAWKNGEFRLKNVSIDYLLRQASRWYDVNFIYACDPKEINFSGVLSRKENVSKLLEVLTATNKVKFKQEKTGITVYKPDNAK